jgi:hypothetical protein
MSSSAMLAEAGAGPADAARSEEQQAGADDAHRD